MNYAQIFASKWFRYAVVALIAILVFRYILLPEYRKWKVRQYTSGFKGTDVRTEIGAKTKEYAEKWRQLTDTNWTGSTLFGDSDLDDVLDELKSWSDSEIKLLNNYYNLELAPKNDGYSFRQRLERKYGGWSVNSEKQGAFLERLTKIGITV